MNIVTKLYGNTFIILAVIFLIVGVLLLKVNNFNYWLILGGIFAMIGVIIKFQRFVETRRNEE